MDLLPYRRELLADQCEELDAWRVRLDHRGPLRRAWAGRLRRDLETEVVAASTSMEGVPVTVDEVRRILAGQATPEVRTEDQELVRGYREAMEFVLRRADDPTFAWSTELVVALHDRVLAGRYDLGAARLRTERAAFVVDSRTGEQIFLPPPGEQVPALVQDLCATLQAWDDHPAIASAWAHVATAAIHPFRDGNGRVARVLASLAMYRGGFQRQEFTSLEEWWGRHLSDYYSAFACLGSQFEPDTDVTPFLRAHIEGQLHQVRALHVREQVQGRIWDVLEDLAEASNLDRRAANSLWEAFFVRDVTAGYYRSVADVSPATATSDLAAAVSADLLKAEGRRRGRRYRPGESLHDRVAAELGIEVAGPADVARDRIVSELSARVIHPG
jgi:Fic family protein